MRSPAVRRLGALPAGVLTALTLATGLSADADAALRGSASMRSSSLGPAHAFAATPSANPAPATPAPKPRPGPAGQLLWSADFESSAFDPFKDYFENVDAPEPKLVTGPVAQGARAGRFEAPSGSPRNEVLMDGELVNGTTRYFGWSMQLAATTSTVPGWRVLAQWRHNGRNGSPPVSLKLEDGEYMIDGGWIDTARSTNDVGEKSLLKHHGLGPAGADRGKYVRWVFGIKFAVGDPAQGWVSVWKNGVQLADQVPWRTMYRQKSDGRPFTSSLKFGIYRDAGIGGTDVVHHDNWKMGTTYASVAG